MINLKSLTTGTNSTAHAVLRYTTDRLWYTKRMSIPCVDMYGRFTYIAMHYRNLGFQQKCYIKFSMSIAASLSKQKRWQKCTVTLSGAKPHVRPWDSQKALALHFHCTCTCMDHVDNESMKLRDITKVVLCSSSCVCVCVCVCVLFLTYGDLEC